MTITELQDSLALYIAAEKKILEGNQSWTVGNQSFTKADLGDIRRAITSLRNELFIKQNGGGFGCSQVVLAGRR